MRRLYHWMLDPHGRTVRLSLAEKSLTTELISSPPWSPHADVAKLAVGASGVALVHRANDARYTAIGGQAICEYLEEDGKGPRLLPHMAEDRAEARRIWRWSEDGFASAVSHLLRERVAMARARTHTPDSAALRTGSHALRGRLTFLNQLAELRPFLAGRTLTLADLSVAAHLSCFDYFNDVPWTLVPDLRDWYSRMKSRPSFRPFLEETLDGARPADHYADLDF
ncbi:MAG: glutathione S-transferase family protein [Pseudomonadota bacterium]